MTAGPDDASDVFYVIGITNRHHLEGMPDPIMEFIEAAITHGERLVAEGLRVPEVVQIDVEVYSLSFTHRDEFPSFGAASRPMTSGTDEYFMSLYFLNDAAYQLALRLGVHLPPILKTIRRDELPERRGAPIPKGQHFLDRA